MVKVINANKSCSLQKEIIKAKASTCLRQSTMSDMDVFTKSAVCQKISTEWQSHLLGYKTILREVGRPPPSQLVSHATFILLKSMNILWINFDMPSFAWNSTLLTLLRAYRSMSLVCFEIFVWSFFFFLFVELQPSIHGNFWKSRTHWTVFVLLPMISRIPNFVLQRA